MLTLQVSTGTAEGKVFFPPLFLKMGTMFIEQVGQAENRRPEANDGGGPHQLVMICTQQVFDVLEEDLDLPADGEDVEHRLGVGIHRGGAQFAHPSADDMDVDSAFSLQRYCRPSEHPGREGLV